MTAVDLSCREWGDGLPLVMLHAFPLSSALFTQETTMLPGWRTLTPDLRGFGRSPMGDDPPSLAAMAEDVVALLDRQGIDRAVVGGVSMGGYVTMELLRAAPDRVAGVVLVDTRAEADTEQAKAARVSMAEAVLERGSYLLDPMMAVLLGETTRARRPDVVRLVSGWLDEVDPRAVAWAQRAMAQRPDSHAVLRACGLPGVVIVGAEDALSPAADAASMAADLGTEHAVVPQAGHLAVVENPAAVRAHLVGGLARVRQAMPGEAPS